MNTFKENSKEEPVSNQVQYYPLTHPQKAIWYTEKVYGNTGIGNVAATLRLKGEVDFSLLEKAVNKFIENNEGMRLRIIEQDGEPKQYVSEFKYRKIDFFDFSGKEIEKLYKLDEKLSKEPFKLIDSELFYFALVKISDTDGGFFIKTHHLISDAWNMTILGNQIVENYSVLKNKGEILEEKPSYIDYILSEKEYKESNRFERDKEFWHKKIQDFPEKTILKARNSNDIITKASRKTLLIPKKLTEKINRYCNENKTSSYTLFVAALSMYINRVTGKEDIVLGTTTLNRLNAKEKETVGMFSNTAPIEIHIDDNINFKAFAEFIGKQNITLLRHQKYPYDLLLKEARARNKALDGLFDIVLIYQNSKFNKGKQEEEYITRWHFNGHQIEALIINVNDREEEGHLIIDYDYLIDIFHLKEIEFIHQHIVNLLWHALDNPTKKISKLDMLSEKERFKILYEFNDTKADYPKEKTIQKMFEEQVERTPNNIAVVFEDKHLTYKELNEKSNQVARMLRAKGVKPDSIIGIMVYRSLEMIIGIMGILKAGGAYLPIDPEYPEDRIEYMLEDSSTKVLLTQTGEKGRIKFDGEIINLENKELYSEDKLNPQNINKPNDLAYIIYTSGSTGKPKGVMIEHYSVINRINWMHKKYPINQNSAILQKTPFTFDVSVWELFWWSFVGAKVCMLKPNGEKEPEEIIKAIEKNRITTMHFVPSMLSIFLQYIDGQIDLQRLSSLKQVFASGEALTLQKVMKFNELLNKTNGTELYNLYGPTEATVDVSYFDCSTGDKLSTIPIGKPIDNISLYVLDKNNNLQPICIPGELCIGGDGVARGYINKPELTAEKFMPNPFIPGDKLYKTGDLTRWFPNGDIEYLGRMDFQVKIRGNRIELGEIENRLLEHKNIKDAVVMAREDNGKNKYLCAYVVCDEDVEASELKEHLSKKLPDYMVPSYFVKLDKIPLSSNGKADRKALPEPCGNIEIETEYTAPRNEIEKLLAQAWSEVLKLDKVGINDNIFNLGGDSLTIIEILTKIYKYNWNLTAKDFYKYQTIKGISDKIRGISESDDINNRIDIETIEQKEEVTFISQHKNKLENVLLTGSTGFLGIHVLRDLIENTDANIYCLVRGESKATAENRLKNLLRFYFNNEYSDLIGIRICVVKGDITSDNFGLTEKEYDELGKNVDTIIHTAAIVKYYGDYSEFEKVNVFGTRRIIDFSLKYRKKLNHISTISITGNYLVDDNINYINFTENDFYVGQNYTDSVYVRSKFETENLIFKAIKKGLDVTIFRMGNLTGRYSDGHFQQNITENAFYSTIKSIIQLGAVPEELLEEDIEFTPIDYASKAVLTIAKTKESSGRIFHIFDHNTIKMKDIAEIFTKIGIKIKITNKEQFKEQINNISNDQSKQSILAGIINDISETIGLNYKISIYIDSEISQRYLIKLGFEWPMINQAYISKLIKHMKEMGYIS